VKRITVSLPDELAERLKEFAGGERTVSSYMAAALRDYLERETLDEILAAWGAETPVSEDVPRQVDTELDEIGLSGPQARDDRLAG
jgi:predicted transcriptional regulator